jgi:hypothetical protein
VDVQRSQIKAWFKGAHLGDAASQFNLGLGFMTASLGLPFDLAKAIRWLAEAAEQGLVCAQCNLGQCFEAAQDYTQAVKWYVFAELQGDPVAKRRLADLLDRVCSEKNAAVAVDAKSDRTRSLVCSQCVVLPSPSLAIPPFLVQPQSVPLVTIRGAVTVSARNELESISESGSLHVVVFVHPSTSESWRYAPRWSVSSVPHPREDGHMLLLDVECPVQRGKVFKLSPGLSLLLSNASIVLPILDDCDSVHYSTTTSTSGGVPKPPLSAKMIAFIDRLRLICKDLPNKLPKLCIIRAESARTTAVSSLDIFVADIN